MPATEQPVALPTRYRVSRLIARGGMASVWEAEDEVLGRRVAVKVLSRALDADERAHRRFLREARAAARLGDCRNVVTVYDIGEHEGRSFIVMEHFAGGTVADRLRAGGVPRPVALQWLREAATALDCAHGKGVVHRDVKPGNLMLDDDARLAVGDFGIATVASEASVTQTGQVLGTAAYLSPEQARGRVATSASDRYALAVVAYELLTGRRPFDAEHPAAQARAHVEAEVPDASATGALPAAVGAVLRAGMAKDPDDRPDTAAELVDRLEAALGDAAAEGPPTEVTRRLAPVASAAPPPATPRPRTPRPPSDPWTPAPAPAATGGRRRIPLLVAVCALALVAGAVAAIALGGGGDGTGSGDGTQARGTGADTATAQRGDSTSSSRGSSSSTGAAASTASSSTESAPSQTQTQQDTQTQQAPQAPAQGDPKALNDRGFALIQQENPGAAVPLLQGSVQGFRDQGRKQEIDYAFALYNLANALRLTGRPAEAIPLLEERLHISDYKRGVVKRELRVAQEQAGSQG